MLKCENCQTEFSDEENELCLKNDLCARCYNQLFREYNDRQYDFEPIVEAKS